jgi:hypothetical protein
VRRLEEVAVDAWPSMPSGESLAAEVERFLRDHGGGAPRDEEG